MKKQLIVTTIAAGSLLGSVTTVGAQEQATNVTKPTSDAPITTEVKSVETTTVAKPVTNEDVTDAKTNAANADKNVADKKAEVTEVDNKVVEVKGQIEKTESDIKLAESVTPGQVAEAKKAETEAQEKADHASEMVKTLEKSKGQLAERITESEKLADASKEDIKQAQDWIDSAQQKVDSLQGNVDTSELSDKVKGLETKVAQDEVGVTSAKNSLDQAKLAQENKEKAIKKAEQAVSDAHFEVNNANGELSSKTLVKQRAEEKLNQAQAEFDALKGEVADASVRNTISVSDEYVSLLKQYAKNPTDELANKIVEVANKEMLEHGYVGWDGSGSYSYLKSQFKSKAKDLTELVDVDNLTDEQNKEITLFAVDLINQIRTKFGTTPLVVTEDSIRLAKDIAKLSKEPDNHDDAAMDKVSEANGGLSFSEDISYDFKTPKNMDELKRAVYQGVILMMFHDNLSNQAHALNLTQLDRGNKPDKQYMGVGVRTTTAYGLAVHYLGHTDFGNENPKYFDKTKVVVSDANELSKRANAKLSAAESNLVNAKTEFAFAENELKNAEETVAKASITLANAKKTFSDLLNGTIDIPALEQAVKDAETTLATDKKALADVTEALRLANGSASEKAKLLEKAKSELESAKRNKQTKVNLLTLLEEATEGVRKAHRRVSNDLVEWQAKQKTTATDLSTAKEKSAKLSEMLTNRDSVLKHLNAELNSANLHLSDLRGALEVKLGELKDLVAIAEEKRTVYENLKARKEAQDAEEAEAKRLQALKEKEAQIKADGGVVTPVFDASGKLVDYTDGRVQDTKQLTVNTATKFTQSEGSKTASAQLPETGTASSTWVSALGIALASIGFVGFGLKRKEEN